MLKFWFGDQWKVYNDGWQEDGIMCCDVEN